jgi:hypothetical protein
MRYSLRSDARQVADSLASMSVPHQFSPNDDFFYAVRNLLRALRSQYAPIMGINHQNHARRAQIDADRRTARQNRAGRRKAASEVITNVVAGLRFGEPFRLKAVREICVNRYCLVVIS